MFACPDTHAGLESGCEKTIGRSSASENGSSPAAGRVISSTIIPVPRLLHPIIICRPPRASVTPRDHGDSTGARLPRGWQLVCLPRFFCLAAPDGSERPAHERRLRLYYDAAQAAQRDP